MGTILILAPHMDDEVLACGGVIHLLPHRERIHVVYATDGMKSPAPIVPWRDSITPDLGDIRMAESRSAMEYLGVPVANTYFLKLPEAELNKNLQALNDLLFQEIEEINPDQILMPFRYDRHPDHLAINHVVTAAYEQGHFPRANLYEYFVYHRWRLLPKKDIRHYISPQYLLEVNTEDVAAEKRAALNCFKSQTTKFYSWQTRPILTPMLLDEESQQPEYFLRYDPSAAGGAVFSDSVTWIRIAHRLEPFLQKSKYRVGAFLYRKFGINGSWSS